MTTRPAFLLAAVGALAACTNPSFIGVQDYGTIIGNVVDGAGKPIAGALVSATGTGSTFLTNADGSFTLPHVAVGTQTIHVSAAGYGEPSGTISVLVVKDATAAAGNITLTSTVAGHP